MEYLLNELNIKKNCFFLSSNVLKTEEKKTGISVSLA